MTAKIDSGEWDGIIDAHSSFERTGVSRDYQKDVRARNELSGES